MCPAFIVTRTWVQTYWRMISCRMGNFVFYGYETLRLYQPDAFNSFIIRNRPYLRALFRIKGLNYTFQYGPHAWIPWDEGSWTRKYSRVDFAHNMVASSSPAGLTFTIRRLRISKGLKCRYYHLVSFLELGRCFLGVITLNKSSTANLGGGS